MQGVIRRKKNNGTAIGWINKLLRRKLQTVPSLSSSTSLPLFLLDDDKKEGRAKVLAVFVDDPCLAAPH